MEKMVEARGNRALFCGALAVLIALAVSVGALATVTVMRTRETRAALNCVVVRDTPFEDFPVASVSGHTLTISVDVGATGRYSGRVDFSCVGR